MALTSHESGKAVLESPGESPSSAPARYLQLLKSVDPIKAVGRVTQAIGLVIESRGPKARIGELCRISNTRRDGETGWTWAEVVGFREEKVLLMALGDRNGIEPGSEVVATGRALSVRVGPGLLGRVIDGLGNPIDGKGPIDWEDEYPIEQLPPDPLSRKRIQEPLALGVRAIDGILTCGKGQRVGIFSGSGVGKSTLLGMIARNTTADVNVIALIGERGREVREFIEKDLGDEGLARSVVIVATSDKAALVRLKGALLATAVAEYFRDMNKDVMLMMDSLTRFAMAQREIGLAIGEPPTTRGYTPSVFSLLPRLLERAGTSSRGSITGLYTVLVEADDMNEPIADAARSILDGHIVLTRELAAANHYPAIDVLSSVSRVMVDITSKEHQAAANRLRDVLATYKEAQDLINIGAYVAGSNPKIDYALSVLEEVNAFLRQDMYERADYTETVERVKSIFR
ncbi:MAG TPA: flagellar protein export ATPase FliI [Firmicutes bacterium]|nr:flagellar protein export ATPase FliI [Bacillota bacterium]